MTERKLPCIISIKYWCIFRLQSKIDEETLREEILGAVTRHAKDETECFYEQAYDWREDDSAGRWSQVYPQQAYLASEDLAWFLKELEAIQIGQKDEIETCITELRKTVGVDLPAIVQQLWNRAGDNYDPTQGATEMSAYYLRSLAQLLYGEYRCDSGFYNTSTYTARLYERDLNQIRENPKDWALVMFDYHY